MSPGPKLPKWLPKPYGTSSLSTMGYPERSPWIKVKTLKVSWWLTSVNWWGCGKYVDQPVPSANQQPVWKDSISPWSICLGPYPRKRSQSGRNTLEHWSMHITAPENSATGFSPYFLMFGRQPHLPVNITLGLAPHTVTEPNTSKFVQKIREHTLEGSEKSWGISGQRSAQWHKCNYDKWGRAAALEVGDTVLVCVTTFKGHHKIQGHWENSEHVVEKWPYPTVPVYVVCPREGEGHSQTLHRNYLLPISPNLEQGKMEKPVVGVGNDT